MKLLWNSLLLVAAAGLGLAAGLWWRSSRSVETGTLAGGRETLRGVSGGLARPANARSGARRDDDSPLATQLERDLSMSSGVTRWLHWMEALEKAAPNDFPRLARLSRGNPTATRLVAARWVEVAPRHLFDLLVAEAKSGRDLFDQELTEILFTSLFNEWPKRDPDAVIAALSEAGVFGARDRWRWQVAYTVVETDIERGLGLMAEWHLDDTGFGPRGLAAVKKWTRADPLHAAEFLLKQPAGYGTRSTMEAVGAEWAKRDPAGALAFASSQTGELGSILATSALKEWAGRNLKEAAGWLTAADDTTRNRLSPAFVEVWAKRDAASALTWCEDNLTGSTLARAASAVVTGAAERDVASAAELVASMSPSAARAEAAEAVARKWFPELSSGQPVAPEAITWLAGLDDESARRALERVTWSWATSDPQSLATFLTGASREQVMPFAYDVTARELARRNPADALAWAAHLSEEHALTAGSAAFGEWRMAQPDAAMKWLNDLPADDPRRPGYFQGVVRSLAYHPQAVEQLAALSVTERAAARSVIETMPLAEDRRARLLAALRPR